MNDLIEKTKKDYDAIAEEYASTRFDAGSDLQQFKPFISPGQRVLDWGCGNGRLLYCINQTLAEQPFQASGTSRLEYIGLDQSEGLLAIARESFKDLVADGEATFLSVAEEEKDFPENYFDLTCAIASFHHLPDEASRLALLKKMFFSLKPGGKLLMTVWNLESEWANTRKAQWTELGEQDWLIPWKNNAGDILAERYYHMFTLPELAGIITLAGFVVNEIYYATDAKAVSKNDGRNIVVIATKQRSS
jgi:SAM-dependent methyltransferase